MLSWDMDRTWGSIRCIPAISERSLLEAEKGNREVRLEKKGLMSGQGTGQIFIIQASLTREKLRGDFLSYK